MKKGFTLIELLATIVILAVIALIATPVVMGAINSAKQGAAKDSAYSYMSTLEYYIASTHADDDTNNDFVLNGTLTETEANTLLSNVIVKGSQPTGLSDVVISDGKIVDAKILVGGYTVNVDNGIVSTVVEGTAPANYNITLSGMPTGVSLSKTTASVGETITITLSEDYTAGSITVNGTPLTYSDGYSFTMPATDTTVVATLGEIYGVSFAGTATGTRLNKAVGETYTKNASTITSSLDNNEIYKDIKDVTDTLGNKFVEIPKFYIKKTVNANGNFTYQISKYKKDNTWYLPYSFQKDDGTELPYVWIGKYDASLNGTKLESKSGTTPLVDQTMATFRTYSSNNNTGGLLGYQLIDIHAVDIIQTLFYVEFATLDSQSIMKGFTSETNFAPIKSGATDSVITASGSPTSNTTGTYAMKYRGIENFYGNIWQFIDGLNVQNNVAYVNAKPSTYASDVFSGDYKAVGYTNALTNGNVSKMGYDSTKPFVQLPIEVGTSTYGDYFYRATGNRVVVLGGSWADGSDAGVSYWYPILGSVSTDSGVGSRIIKKAL